ncbi:MAG: cytochrome c oxidase subunit II [Bdellovibrionota bacterium]
MISLLPESVSSFAGEVDFLIVFIAVVVFAWLIAAEAILFYFCFKFKAKKGQKAQYITGENKSEMKWISIPHFAVLVFDIIILVMAINVWYQIKQELPEADETIGVVGYQWAWRFTHPGEDHKLGTEDDVETVDELRLKVGKTYHFKLQSADVIHSFSVPVFRLKQDAIPGRVITGWFKPTKVGQWDLQCAEMCGIGHGVMGARVFVESDDDHNKWLKNKRG